MTDLSAPVFGPIKRSKLDLMGIRFADGEAGGAPAAPSAPAAPAAPEPPAAASAPAAGAAPAQNVSDLPEWAQRELQNVRQEAANNRVGKTQAEQQAQNILTAVAKAAGIEIPGEKPDAEALTASLTAAQAKAQESERKLAIFQGAATTGADPGRLLDSNSFMSSVAGLDPTDGAAINAAITAAITANPLLKAVQAAAASGTELGGTGETGQITEQQMLAMSDEQRVAALKAGKLQHLLT